MAETLTCGKLRGAYFGAAVSCCMPKALNARAMLGVACYMSVRPVAYHPMTYHNRSKGVSVRMGCSWVCGFGGVGSNSCIVHGHNSMAW